MFRKLHTDDIGQHWTVIYGDDGQERSRKVASADEVRLWAAAERRNGFIPSDAPLEARKAAKFAQTTRIDVGTPAGQRVLAGVKGKRARLFRRTEGGVTPREQERLQLARSKEWKRQFLVNRGYDVKVIDGYGGFAVRTDPSEPYRVINPTGWQGADYLEFFADYVAMPVLETTGEIAGGIIGAAEGAVLGAPGGLAGVAAGATTGAVAGSMVGGAAGAGIVEAARQFASGEGDVGAVGDAAVVGAVTPSVIRGGGKVLKLVGGGLSESVSWVGRKTGADKALRFVKDSGADVIEEMVAKLSGIRQSQRMPSTAVMREAINDPLPVLRAKPEPNVKVKEFWGTIDRMMGREGADPTRWRLPEKIENDSVMDGLEKAEVGVDLTPVRDILQVYVEAGKRSKKLPPLADRSEIPEYVKEAIGAEPELARDVRLLLDSIYQSRVGNAGWESVPIRRAESIKRTFQKILSFDGEWNRKPLPQKGGMAGLLKDAEFQTRQLVSQAVREFDSGLGKRYAENNRIIFQKLGHLSNVMEASGYNMSKGRRVAAATADEVVGSPVGRGVNYFNSIYTEAGVGFEEEIRTLEKLTGFNLLDEIRLTQARRLIGRNVLGKETEAFGVPAIIGPFTAGGQIRGAALIGGGSAVGGGAGLSPEGGFTLEDPAGAAQGALLGLGAFAATGPRGVVAMGRILKNRGVPAARIRALLASTTSLGREAVTRGPAIEATRQAIQFVEVGEPEERDRNKRRRRPLRLIPQ